MTWGKGAYLLGGGLLIVVGLLDDRYDLRWWWRILAQVVAALLMVYLGGVRIEQLGPADCNPCWALRDRLQQPDQRPGQCCRQPRPPVTGVGLA